MIVPAGNHGSKYTFTTNNNIFRLYIIVEKVVTPAEEIFILLLNASRNTSS
jgi:hypothetical protein